MPAQVVNSGYSITETGTGSPSATLDFSGVASTSLGDDWYDLGYVPLNSGETSIIVHYSGSSAVPGGVCLLEQTSAAAYDADGEVTATTDALGRVSASTYDSLGQVVAGYRGQVNNSATGSPPAWAFNNLAPNNQSSYDVYGYSATASLNDTVLDVNNTAIGTPDDPTAPSLGAGWYLLGTVTASGSTLTLTYGSDTIPDAVCLLQQTSATAYDADGEVTAATDALGNQTTYAFDSFGRLLTTTQPTVGVVIPVTSYTYDAEGNTLTETDPDGNVTTYSYDSFNRMISESQKIAVYLDSSDDPVTTTATTDYTYDADGNLLEEAVTDQDTAILDQEAALGLDPGLHVTDFQYDSMNRETGEQWYESPTAAISNAISYTYDADGELLTAQDTYALPNAGDSSSYTYTYNSLGEQISVDNSGSGSAGRPARPACPMWC